MRKSNLDRYELQIVGAGEMRLIKPENIQAQTADSLDRTVKAAAQAMKEAAGLRERLGAGKQLVQKLAAKVLAAAAAAAATPPPPPPPSSSPPPPASSSLLLLLLWWWTGVCGIGDHHRHDVSAVVVMRLWS